MLLSGHADIPDHLRLVIFEHPYKQIDSQLKRSTTIGTMWSVYTACPTLRLMLLGISNNRHISSGTYRLCRNPLYAVLLLFLIPGLGLLLDSWIILTTTIVVYLVFRILIHEEEEL